MQNSVPWSLWSIGHIPFFANQKNLQKRNFFFPFLKESSRGEKSLDCREFSAEYIVRLDVCINDTVSTQDHTYTHTWQGRASTYNTYIGAKSLFRIAFRFPTRFLTFHGF